MTDLPGVILGGLVPFVIFVALYLLGFGLLRRVAS